LHRSRAALLATICLLTLSAEGRSAAQTPPPDAGAAPAVAPPSPATPPAAKPRAHRKARPASPPLSKAEQGDTIQAIKIEGNARIEDGTILSYMLVQPGDPFGTERVDRSLRTLYATGLFSDVSLQREDNTLVVHVRENPLVNTISFEGNHNVK